MEGILTWDSDKLSPSQLGALQFILSSSMGIARFTTQHNVRADILPISFEENIEKKIDPLIQRLREKLKRLYG
jgi:hypothetical protein